MEPQPEHEPSVLPRHVAIIMDGNGRWAAARGLPRALGHRAGVEVVRSTVEASVDLGIEYLTLFGFSSENWNRSAREVSELMALLRSYLSREIAELHTRNICIRVIGERWRLPKDLVSLIAYSENLTRQNTRLTLTLALSYGGRQAIVHAARRLGEKLLDGVIAIEDIDEATLRDQLETDGVPDPDLLIRTSGEKRISNFMLWECAYSEMVFLDSYWPDFTRADFTAAIAEFGRRDRRFGVAI